MFILGSLVCLGFDEEGEHGMIVGEILENNIQTRFIPIDDVNFENKKIDISQVLSIEDLIEKLDGIYSENTYYRIVLIGNRNFEINKNKIMNLISNDRILKIHDNTESAFNLEEIKHQKSLKGIFVKNMLKKLEEEPENEVKIKRAIEIGLRVLE